MSDNAEDAQLSRLVTAFSTIEDLDVRAIIMGLTEAAARGDCEAVQRLAVPAKPVLAKSQFH